MKYLIMAFLLTANSLSAEQHPPTLTTIITKAEKQNRLPAGLLSAVIAVESNHNHKAFVKEDGVSRKASFGLLQIQLATARQMGFKGKPRDLMKPEVNVKYGAAYMKWLLNMYHNDYAKALTCYNAGPYSSNCKNNKYGTYAGKVLNALIKEKK